MLNAIKSITTFLVLCLFTSTAFTADDNSFFVWADVVDVDPIVTTRYEKVPTTDCRIVKRRHDHGHNQEVLPALFGGVLGGVVGNQFGKGNGKKAMTVVGAIAGASIATQQASPRWRQEKVCETDYKRRRIDVVDGYRVTYEYLNQQFEGITQEHPGDRMKLYVTAKPASDNYI